MTDFSTLPPTEPPAPKSKLPWIIGGALLLCCCCVILIPTLVYLWNNGDAIFGPLLGY